MACFTYNYISYMDEIEESTEINSDAKLVLGKILRLLNLSHNHGSAFYDRKGGFYYAVFSHDDAVKKCGLKTPYRARNAFNQLEDAGLIKRHKSYHYYEIEVPSFENLTSRPSKSNGLSKESRTKTTDNIESNTTQSRRTKAPKPDYRKEQLGIKLSRLDLENLSKHTIARTGLDKVVKKIKLISADTPSFYKHIFRLFFNAKISVRRDFAKKLGKHSNKYKNVVKGLRFENNYMFYNSKYVANLVYYDVRKGYKHAKEAGKFITTCFKNIFKLGVVNYLATLGNGPKIPDNVKL